MWAVSRRSIETLAFGRRGRRYIVGAPSDVPVLMGKFLALVILDTFWWPFRR
jgi:hypothetical protein